MRKYWLLSGIVVLGLFMLYGLHQPSFSKDHLQALLSLPSFRTPYEGFKASASTVTPDASVEIVGNNDALLRKLTFRALNSMVNSGLNITKIKVLVGALPEHWIIDLPLREQTSVIGAIVSSAGPISTTQVFLDVTQPAQTVLDAYKTKLEKQGFRVVDLLGFSHMTPIPNSPRQTESFCRKDIDLSFYGEQVSLTLTKVRLTLQTFTASPCITSSYTSMAPLPNHLADPPGSILRGSSAGMGGLAEVSITQNLETNLSSQALQDFYAKQLAAMGWQKIETGKTQMMVWSIWSFTDERHYQWVGTVMISGNLVSPTYKTVVIGADHKPAQ